MNRSYDVTCCVRLDVVVEVSRAFNEDEAREDADELVATELAAALKAAVANVVADFDGVVLESVDVDSEVTDSSRAGGDCA